MGTRGHLVDSLAILRWHLMFEGSLQSLSQEKMPTLMQSMTKVEWMPLDGGTCMGKVTCTSNLLLLRSCHK